MPLFIAHLIVKKGREAEFEKLQIELSELTHELEPDCLAYDVIRHKEKPQTYVVYARFKDEAAFEMHQKNDFHDRLVPPILDCLQEDMDLHFYDWIA